MGFSMRISYFEAYFGAASWVCMHVLVYLMFSLTWELWNMNDVLEVQDKSGHTKIGFVKATYKI